MANKALSALHFFAMFAVMINNASELQSKIINIYNHLYANSFRKTPHGISIEVGKILHTGMYIEEKEGKPTAFSFDVKQIKELRENEIAINEFSKYIHKSYSEMCNRWGFYEKDDLIGLSSFDVAYTCSILNFLQLSNTAKDIFGDTIEIIRAQWAKSAGGQFFTDSLVTNLAMTLLDFDPEKGEDLVDICSGTGGFLLAGLNHIKELLQKKGQLTEKKLVALARKSLKGQEIDADVCQIANSSLATRLGHHPEPFVTNGDSLNPETFKLSKRISYGKHKCVASNPPFGTKITIKDFKILREYELAKQHSRNEPLLFQDKLVFRAPDILFLEQNVKLLIPGAGRLAIVLPYQILSGPQTQFIRQWLLRNTKILSVIDLPSETFQPHTGTKTSLVTVQRRKTPAASIEEIEDYPIFMSVPKWIGHDRRGNPVFKKLPNGQTSDEILTDFPELKSSYLAYLRGDEPSKIHADSFITTSKAILSSEATQINAQFHKPSNFNIDIKAKDDWQLIPLEKLTKRIFYPGRFKRDYVAGGSSSVPFFGGADINQLTTETGKWISSAHPKLDELAVKSGWILITRSGSTGIVSIVPDAWDGFAMSEHIIRIVPDETIVDKYYLFSFLKSQYCQEIVAKGVFGSVIDEIDPAFVGKIEVLMPRNKKELEEIVSEVKHSETARNEAILYSKNSLERINRLLNTEFAI